MIDRIALQEVAKIVQGGRHGLSGNQFVTAGFPAYGAGGLNGYLPNFEFNRDAVILSSIGARCGKCFFARGKWSSLANTQVILPEAKIADAKFLWFQLNDERRWPRSGTGQPFIRPSDVKEHIVILPPLSEQKRIAALLEKADRLRRTRRYARQLSDTFLQSVFLEMFGELRTNSRGFDAMTIGDALKLKSGESMTAANMGHGGKYPVYGGNGIHGYHTNYLFAEPKIVIGRVGIYCGVVHYTEPNCWVSDNALYVAEKDKRLDEVYLVHALKEANLNQYADRAGQPLISQGRLEKVRILVPPPPLQQKFAAIVRSFERLRAQQREAERQTEHLFQTLLHRAFREEV